MWCATWGYLFFICFLFCVANMQKDITMLNRFTRRVYDEYILPQETEDAVEHAAEVE